MTFLGHNPVLASEHRQMPKTPGLRSGVYLLGSHSNRLVKHLSRNGSFNSGRLLAVQASLRRRRRRALPS
jgi:hypothetical protein